MLQFWSPNYCYYCVIGASPMYLAINLLTPVVTQPHTGATEITPTFRKITVGSPKQVVGWGPFR
jgi:hypothetical protein